MSDQEKKYFYFFLLVNNSFKVWTTWPSGARLTRSWDVDLQSGGAH